MLSKPTNRQHSPAWCRVLGAPFLALVLAGSAYAASPPDQNSQTTPAQRGQATLLIQSSPLAGSQFHALADVVSQIRVGDTLTLKRDPTNPHDSNAIQVLWQGHMLGFVPRRENRAVARAMDRGEPLVARVVALRPEESPWRRLRFEISVRLSD
ncbi:MAG: hypothetical protein RL651_2025 [Pseudomonadota bacterium]